MTRKNKQATRMYSSGSIDTKHTQDNSKGINILHKYLKEHLAQRYDLQEFEERVNEQMAAYEQIEEQRKNEQLAKGEEPDEDGFTTVVSKRPKVFEAESEPETKEDLYKEAKLLSNFYKFVGRGQEKERMEQMEKVKEKFELDKKKLAELKSAKIFKPLS